MEIHPELFGLREAIEEVCAVVSPLAMQRGITVRREVTGAPESVTLDRHKLIQVLYNLLSNAVKFTNEAGHAALLIDRPSAAQLRIRVTDDGIGIRREDFGQLFVEFKQLDSGTTRRYQGTGLGLALTRRIVELQHGTIGVDSEPGKGSTFTVTLPLSPADMAKP